MTQIQGGIARNVIPDRAEAFVNYRYPPGMSAARAVAKLHALCDPYGELSIDGNAPSGPVPQENPLIDGLRSAGALDLGPKQAWTPVAEFGGAGVDAINFGPGDPPQAHTRTEHVSLAALAHCRRVLDAFIRGTTL